jgi:hypothetical protein
MTAPLPVPLRALATVAFVAATLPSKAEEFCVAPVSPSCAKLDATYENAVARQRCQDEIDDFAEESRSYADCLNQKAAVAIEAADTEVDYFRCRMEGGEDCPSDKTGSVPASD